MLGTETITANPSFWLKIGEFFRNLYQVSEMPVRTAMTFWLLFITIYILVGAYERIHKRVPTRKTLKKNYHGTLYLFGLITVIIHYVSIEYGWMLPIDEDKGNAYKFVQIVGFGFLTLGLYMVAAARIRLNGYWGVHIYEYSDGGRLITDGIYRHCRHPVYFGQACLTVGTTCVSNNLVTVILPIATISLCLWRAIIEEKELRTRFKDEFIRYHDMASFFIPYIR